jgi:hypothetical protein
MAIVLSLRSWHEKEFSLGVNCDAANKGVDLLVPLYSLFCTILAVLSKQKEKNTCLPYLDCFLAVL